MKIKKCIICNNEFIPKDSRIETCSYECKGKLYDKRRFRYKSKKCKNCGKEFNPYYSIQLFCSANCRIEFQKNKRSKRWGTTENIIGKKNPGYRNGFYMRGKKKNNRGEVIFTKNAKEIEQKMIDSKGYKYCEFCETTQTPRFERHHIIFRSEKPNHPNLHDKGNILIVCIGCHNILHKHKGLRNKIVEKRKLNEIFSNDVLDKRT